MTAGSPSSKRRRSDESRDLGEKRQRVDPGPSANTATSHSLIVNFDDMLAQATGAVMQQHAPSSNQLQSYQEPPGTSCPVVQHEHTEPEVQSSGFMSDPHLYMRILSLPILESLVGRAHSGIPNVSNPMYSLLRSCQL